MGDPITVVSVDGPVGLGMQRLNTSQGFLAGGLTLLGLGIFCTGMLWAVMLRSVLPSLCWALTVPFLPLAGTVFFTLLAARGATLLHDEGDAGFGTWSLVGLLPIVLVLLLQAGSLLFLLFDALTMIRWLL